MTYSEEWLDLIGENDDAVLTESSVVDDEIICHYLESCSSVLRRFKASGEFVDQITLPGKGSACLAPNSPFFSYTDVITPKAIYHFDGRCYFPPHDLEVSEDFVTEQRFFISRDGTEIPLFITCQKGIELTGNHPTLLYGYGGFNISITPSYSSLVITWLEMGGIYACVNLRGGGEFGKKWHEAGSLANKQNVFDDFIAAAEFLIEEGYTNPSKLAINGRSNGGLLVGACLTQRPDLFGAAVPQVGVLDMLNFHRFTVGWSWVSDYGDPDKEGDLSYLLAYSPFHNIKEGISYPPTLITTADQDDRVVPLHSFKFAAKLQDVEGSSAPTLLRVYSNTGHGFGGSLDQVIEENSDILSFLSWSLNIDYRP